MDVSISFAYFARQRHFFPPQFCEENRQAAGQILSPRVCPSFDNCVDRKNIQERTGKGTGYYIHTTGNGSHIRIFFRVFFLLITVISTFIAAIALTLELVPMACFYCLPPVLNGHLKQNYSNKTKNNT